MTPRRRRAAVGVVVLALAAAGAGRLQGQTITLRVPLTSGDSIAAAPPMVVSAVGVPDSAQPIKIQLELSRDPSFLAPFYVRAAETADTTFTVDALLPERTMIWFRATLFDRTGRILNRSAIISHPVRSWIRLGPPGLHPNDVLFTRRPEFFWSPSSLTLPPGPWVFDLSVVNAATGQVDFSVPGPLSDTSFVFPQPLEANTPYRWRLHGRAVNSAANDEITISSQSTFSVASAEQPTATVFYQNFPNPFPSSRSAFTCFWFDLAKRSRVQLTIYDIRLREVKHIVPVGSDLQAGAYGRQGDVSLGGCDGRFSWDGTDDRGHMVPRGVYIAVFDADGARSTKKILFHGR
jgi:hypothetical protein